MIHFTYFKVRDGEIVVKDLAAADSYNNWVSSNVFKRPYVWLEVPLFNANMIQTIYLGVQGVSQKS